MVTGAAVDAPAARIGVDTVLECSVVHTRRNRRVRVERAVRRSVGDELDADL